MKVLYIKELKTRKPDLMGSAIMETFSQMEDVLTIANVEIKGVLCTTQTIKNLINTYQPDIVIGTKMIATFLLFQTPKSVRKIIIDPYLLYADCEDGTKMNIALRYVSKRIYDWLFKVSDELLENFATERKTSCYCIVSNFNQIDRYSALAIVMNETKNILLATPDTHDPIQQLSAYHRYIRKARHYFDQTYDYFTEDELLNDYLAKQSIS